jgi:hypothetical protein
MSLSRAVLINFLFIVIVTSLCFKYWNAPGLLVDLIK